MRDRIDFLWQTHSYINEYIRLAEAKAVALLTVFGALLGLVLDQASGSLSGGERVLLVVAITLSATVMAVAGFVVFPRTRGQPTGAIYWRSVRSVTEEDFGQLAKETTDAQMLDRLSKHVYELAGVATEKYRGLQIAFTVAVAAFVFGIWALTVL